MYIQQLVLASIMVLFLATGNAWAEGSENSRGTSVSSSQSTSGPVSQTISIHSWLDQLGAWKVSQIDRGRSSVGSEPVSGGVREVVPEIDATSGTSAIALLVGALLLAGERVRSRRS